jgi:acetolactate synthase-1/2/3 large subunit
MNYATLSLEWLHEFGYTHCFFVAGGNIMHLLNAARQRMTCIPFVHEVAAGIAAEYHNEARPGHGRAFVLVTAGPGVTNVLTAMAGAWLESRELLVLAGQVKRSDLATGGVRQRGIQEIDGVALAAPISIVAERLDEPWERRRLFAAVERGRTGRKAPVFLEYPLDVQGIPIESHDRELLEGTAPQASSSDLAVRQAKTAAPEVLRRIRSAERPVLLIGGGVSRAVADLLAQPLRSASIAVMTTWNGADRVDSRNDNYFGRPNTWGMRYANVLIQQADLIVALGTRLGLQQTGFNWQAFAPEADVVQFDIDQAELQKGHPAVALPVAGDADTMLQAIAEADLGDHIAWLEFARGVRLRLPTAETENVTAPGFIDPYRFVEQLSIAAGPRDLLIPCSSGGAFTTMMQAFAQRHGQTIITNKGLAAMGYGLSGAIGAALAHPEKRTILVEGDGGFTQNLQELATVDVNRLNLKIFIYANDGYASIRMTQRNYFGGAYMGCDVRSGLGFPRWSRLFEAYGIPSMTLGDAGMETDGFTELFANDGPAAFVVPIDPEQTYYPKITSRVTESGSMESAPLHLMTPELASDVAAETMRYFKEAACPAPL